MLSPSQDFLDVLFHFHVSYHGSDICDCITAIDKKFMKKVSVRSCKWINDGCGLVKALESFPSNFYFDHIEIYEV